MIYLLISTPPPHLLPRSQPPQTASLPLPVLLQASEMARKPAGSRGLSLQRAAGVYWNSHISNSISTHFPFCLHFIMHYYFFKLKQTESILLPTELPMGWLLFSSQLIESLQQAPSQCSLQSAGSNASFGESPSSFTESSI